MRYGAEHKEQSKAKILEAARGLFRKRGFDRSSIDQVMEAAGLTRGAFYAHFSSKDDLVAQVLAIEAGLVRRLQQAAETDDNRAAAYAALADYLDPTQRESVATGCPLVAHPVDAIRGDAIRKEGYTDRLRNLVAAMEETVPGDDAVLISVLAVGAGLLSSASADPALADRIQDVCLREIKGVMAEAG
ncbi:MAG: TetR/AcrR family transcriptional regulator [Acidimicrobiales bacterium]